MSKRCEDGKDRGVEEGIGVGERGVKRKWRNGKASSWEGEEMIFKQRRGKEDQKVGGKDRFKREVMIRRTKWRCIGSVTFCEV